MVGVDILIGVDTGVQLGQKGIAFLAVDPVRGEGMAFTAPYVVIEGIYAVPATSAIRSNEDVDRAGVRIAVGRGSAYDL
ncbi:MAG: ABC transporter substrate-binding protein, partial [Pseudomonadota bacterium]